MIDSTYKLFCAIYVLLAEKLNSSTDELNLYLSDANPFIWKNETSWDPSIYDEFKEKFVKSGSFDLFGLAFAKQYFYELDKYYVYTKEIFSGIADDEYVASMERISKYSYSKMKSLYGIKSAN